MGLFNQFFPESTSNGMDEQWTKNLSWLLQQYKLRSLLVVMVLPITMVTTKMIIIVVVIVISTIIGLVSFFFQYYFTLFFGLFFFFIYKQFGNLFAQQLSLFKNATSSDIIAGKKFFLLTFFETISFLFCRKISLIYLCI